jgi:uncharacterized protein (DUF433 family)
MTATIIDRGRAPEIAGTRITVYDIMDFATAGWHHSQIAVHFRLSTGQVLAALRYIEEHKPEVTAAYQEMLERDAQGNPPELQARLDADHAKFLETVRQRQSANGQGGERAGDLGGR